MNFLLSLVGDLIGILLILGLIILAIVGFNMGLQAIQQKRGNQTLAILELIFNLLSGLGWIAFLGLVFFG